jgi:hypothetical protein
MTEIEHLVTWQEDDGRVIVVLGLDSACRPLSISVLYACMEPGTPELW